MYGNIFLKPSDWRIQFHEHLFETDTCKKINAYAKVRNKTV
jgi:hypothetical protein